MKNSDFDEKKTADEVTDIQSLYISISSGDICSERWHSYSLYLKNAHGTKKIWVNLEIIKERLNDTRITTYKEYIVEPSTEKLIGCPVDNRTGLRSYYRILESKWA
jgi:hypothetical protein